MRGCKYENLIFQGERQSCSLYCSPADNMQMCSMQPFRVLQAGGTSCMLWMKCWNSRCLKVIIAFSPAGGDQTEPNITYRTGPSEKM